VPQKQDVRTRNFSIVVIGTSLGGLSALSVLLGALPADFPAPVLIVQHLARKHVSYISTILARRTALTVKDAVDGEVVQAGTVYIAPPDHHLLLLPDGRIKLSGDLAVHFSRPSIDLLFSSVAEAYQEKVIAVVLTGSGSDGSDGIIKVKQAGGMVIVQQPSSAESSGMPAAAINTHIVDLSPPLEEIAPALINLTMKGKE
jgi:two-component system, chemotaxis family, protein-glutamate methylesterase/glutaminase